MKTPILEYTPVVRDFGTVQPDDRLKPGEMWLFKEPDGTIPAVTFLCPCGCGSECYTPVTPVGQPKTERHWQFDERTTTITPSIRYTGGCKAHFNITSGRTVFHGDSGK